MPPKRRNYEKTKNCDINGPMTRKRQYLKNEHSESNLPTMTKESYTQESSSSSNIEDISNSIPSNHSVGLVPPRNKLNHRQNYYRSNEKSSRILNKYNNTNYNETKNGQLISHNNDKRPSNGISPLNSLTQEEMNSKLFSTKNGNISNVDQNEYYSIIIKYVAEILLCTYFIFSWTFISTFKDYKFFHEPIEDENAAFFSSVEEGLWFKIVWCLVFGCVADLISWRVSFCMQSLLWILLFFTSSIEHFHDFFRFLAATCISSSPILIWSLGITKIWKGENCLPPFIRLFFVTYFFPLCLRLGASESIVWDSLDGVTSVGVLGLRFLYSAFKEYEKMVSASLLITGCAICLILIPALIKEKMHISSTQANINSFHSNKGRASKHFLKGVSLKILVHLPSSLWLIFYNHEVEGSQQTLLMFVPACVLVQCCLLPCLRRTTSLRTSLLVVAFALGLVYFALAWIGLRRSGKLVPLLLCLLTCAFQTLLETQLAIQTKSFIGLTFASLIALHFLIRSFSQRFFDQLQVTPKQCQAAWHILKTNAALFWASGDAIGEDEAGTGCPDEMFLGISYLGCLCSGGAFLILISSQRGMGGGSVL